MYNSSDERAATINAQDGSEEQVSLMPLKSAAPTLITLDLTEEPLTPAEVLTKFKIAFDKKNPNKKIYELTRRRGNRPPMPSHRVGRELRFYWSEISRWQQELQQSRANIAKP